MSLFVDSSVWYGAVDRGDSGHAQATAVLGTGEKLITTNLVLAESHSLLELRLGRAVAERFWERLRRGRVDVEAVTPVDLEVAWTIGRRYRDQELSLVDRSSFAVMERLTLTRVASFDHHFAVYRFGRNRDKSFEIVR